MAVYDFRKKLLKNSTVSSHLYVSLIHEFITDKIIAL